METFALLDENGSVIRCESHRAQPDDPAGKGWKWVPCVDDGIPDYDVNIETLGSPEIRVEDGKAIRFRPLIKKPEQDIAPDLVARIKEQEELNVYDLFILKGEERSPENLAQKQFDLLLSSIATVAGSLLKVAKGGALTTQESDELDAIKETSGYVQHIRAVSERKQEVARTAPVKELTSTSFDTSAGWNR